MDRRDTAMFESSLPCNSRPFVRRLDEILEANDTTSPDSLPREELAKYKANLWLVITHTYGQLFRLDSMDMYEEIGQELEVEV
jgi:hypothetical protein